MKRRHNALAYVWADITEEAGGTARREAFVTEWSRLTDAVADVAVIGIPEAPDLLLDITVRHPLVDNRCARAAEESAYTAIQAEKDKQKRYPATAGRSVWPVAYETFGRAGPDAERLLGTLAAAAKRNANSCGREPGRELQRWRATIDGTLLRGVAAQIHAAQYSLPGRRTQRRLAVDAAALELGGYG